MKERRGHISYAIVFLSSFSLAEMEDERQFHPTFCQWSMLRK